MSNLDCMYLQLVCEHHKASWHQPLLLHFTLFRNSMHSDFAELEGCPSCGVLVWLCRAWKLALRTLRHRSGSLRELLPGLLTELLTELPSECRIEKCIFRS